MHKDSDDSGNEEGTTQQVELISKEVLVDQLTPTLTQSKSFEYIKFLSEIITIKKAHQQVLMMKTNHRRKKDKNPMKFTRKKKKIQDLLRQKLDQKRNHQRRNLIM